MRRDSTAAIGIASRSGAGKLRHLGVKELWVSGACASSKACDQEGSTDDKRAEVGTKYIADGKKLTHLLGLCGVRMTRGLELVTLSVAMVALQGCASIAHVEGTVTVWTAAVNVGVSVVATGCLGLWPVATSRVSQARTPLEINDVKTQCELQQWRHVDAGDVQACANHAVGSWRLSASGIARVLWWSDTMQAVKWLGAQDDTDMCDKDVVIMKLLRMTNTATALQRRALWMRCSERSEPVKLGCVLEKSEASWAIAQFSSRAVRATVSTHEGACERYARISGGWCASHAHNTQSLYLKSSCQDTLIVHPTLRVVLGLLNGWLILFLKKKLIRLLAVVGGCPGFVESGEFVEDCFKYVCC